MSCHSVFHNDEIQLVFDFVDCVLHSTHMFGSFLRNLRESKGLSLRKLAEAVEVEPSYISKVERDLVGPPGEATIKKIALVLEQNPDVMLAMSGKISSDLRQAIIRRPELFSRLIRLINDAPDDLAVRILGEVQDGKW